jgi:hypothetical protein
MWHPNRRQWWIICAAVVLGVVGGHFGGRYGSFFSTIAMLIGGLLIWSAEADRK